MGMVYIGDAGMTFQIDESKLYHIEKTGFYQNLTKGFKRPEFLMERNGRLVFVEAKTSPKAASDETFSQWCNDIKEKFETALLLYNAVRLHRHGDAPCEELPQSMKEVELGNAEYGFCLVIANADKYDIPPIHDKLKSLMNHTLKMWNIKDSAVKVLSQTKARDKQLIA